MVLFLVQKSKADFLPLSNFVDFLTLKFLCEQGERGAAGIDGRPGLDGKPGVLGPPGQRVGGSCRFYLNMNGCYMCVANAVFWLLWHRGILGKQVILGET